MCGEGGWRLSRYTIAISPAYPTDVHEHNTITSGDDSKGRFRVMANLRADLSGPLLKICSNNTTVVNISFIS